MSAFYPYMQHCTVFYFVFVTNNVKVTEKVVFLLMILHLLLFKIKMLFNCINDH